MNGKTLEPLRAFFSSFILHPFLDVSLAAAHRGRLPAAFFVVVAEQVKHAVEEKAREFFLEGHAAPRRLPGGGVEVDRHVAEEEGRAARRRPPPPAPPEPPGLLRGELGKGEDVGGVVAPQVLPVEDAHRPVPDEEDRQLGPLTSQGV